MSVALVLGPYSVHNNMGGIGVRAWELAQVLAVRMPVTIIQREKSDLTAAGVLFASTSAANWRRAIDECSAVIFYDMPDTRMMLEAHRAGKLVISENTVPIEHLEFDGIRHSREPDANYHDLIVRHKLQLLLSDHFIVRSHVGRAVLIASLALVGRLRYVHYDLSPRLEHLWSWIPIGFNRQSLQHAENATASLPITDFVWSGGIWDYYDPVALVEAIVRLKNLGAPITMRFMYEAPGDQVLVEAKRLIGFVHGHGLADLVDFRTGLLPHCGRDAVIKSSRACVCIAKDGIENYVSARLRLRDVFLYRLPVLVDKHGATGDLVRSLGVGIAVDSRRVEEIAKGLTELKDNTVLYSECVRNIDRKRSEFTLDDPVQTLIKVIEKAERAPDVMSTYHGELISRLLAEHPSLEDSPRYPY